MVFVYEYKEGYFYKVLSIGLNTLGLIPTIRMFVSFQSQGFVLLWFALGKFAIRNSKCGQYLTPLLQQPLHSPIYFNMGLKHGLSILILTYLLPG